MPLDPSKVSEVASFLGFKDYAPPSDAPSSPVKRKSSLDPEKLKGVAGILGIKDFDPATAIAPDDTGGLDPVKVKGVSEMLGLAGGDGPLKRGYNQAKSSVDFMGKLATGDNAGAGQNLIDTIAYRERNPGMPEGKELSAAWERGDGILGGISEVGGEIAKDWREAPGAITGIKGLGRNVRAMGEGILEQVPNMVAPTLGMLAGGAAGSYAGPVGTGAGAVVGASLGNAAVEGQEIAMGKLQKAGVNMTNPSAVTQSLTDNSTDILKEAGIKGSVIGVIDTAMTALTGGLLNQPARAAAGRALAELGVDLSSKVAVKTAMQTPEFMAKVGADTVYQASKQGVGNIARNAGAASLDPIGEGAGEYLGTGIATGEYDAKNAALEAFSSVGQSGAMFSGQKAYQYATKPGQSVADNSPAGETPIVPPTPTTPPLPTPRGFERQDIPTGTALTVAPPVDNLAGEWNAQQREAQAYNQQRNAPVIQPVDQAQPAAAPTGINTPPAMAREGRTEPLPIELRQNRIGQELSPEESLSITDIAPSPINPAIHVGTLGDGRQAYKLHDQDGIELTGWKVLESAPIVEPLPQELSPLPQEIDNGQRQLQPGPQDGIVGEGVGPGAIADVAQGAEAAGGLGALPVQEDAGIQESPIYQQARQHVAETGDASLGGLMKALDVDIDTADAIQAQLAVEPVEQQVQAPRETPGETRMREVEQFGPSTVNAPVSIPAAKANESMQERMARGAEIKVQREAFATGQTATIAQDTAGFVAEQKGRNEYAGRVKVAMQKLPGETAKEFIDRRNADIAERKAFGQGRPAMVAPREDVAERLQHDPADDSRYYGTRVTVKGEVGRGGKQISKDFTGTVQRTYQSSTGETLVEVTPDGVESSFRIDGNRVAVNELADNKPVAVNETHARETQGDLPSIGETQGVESLRQANRKHFSQLSNSNLQGMIKSLQGHVAENKRDYAKVSQLPPAKRGDAKRRINDSIKSNNEQITVIEAELASRASKSAPKLRQTEPTIEPKTASKPETNKTQNVVDRQSNQGVNPDINGDISSLESSQKQDTTALTNKEPLTVQPAADEPGKGSKKTGKPKYSVSESAPTEDIPAVTMDTVKQAFPGAEVTEGESGFIVELPNGTAIVIHTDATITLDRAAASEALGKEVGENAVAQGAFISVGRDGIIQLAKAHNKQTLDHEVFHAAEEMVLTQGEIEQLRKQYGSAEATADAYAAWKGDSHLLFEKIKNFFAQLLDILRPNTRATFSKIGSGEAWGRATVTEGIVDIDGSISVDYSVRTKDGSIEAMKVYNREHGIATEAQMDKYADDINSVAAIILGRPLLDYQASGLYSSVKPNSDPHYKWSLDFSTICKKRIRLAATIEALQLKIGRGLTPTEISDVREALKGNKPAPIVVSCGACYVDSTRINLGMAVNRFLNNNPQHETLRERFLTQSGIDKLAVENNDVYQQFLAYIRPQLIKISESRTEYRDELIDSKIITSDDVKTFNSRSGMRWQSWSDFELPHLIDAMQAILHMNSRGMLGHTYTKVADMVRAMGRSGLMINMSLIPEGSGIKNGKLVFSPVEGMAYEEMGTLRDDHSLTAGSIAIGVTDEHLMLLMADPTIDYIIPYHASGLPMKVRKREGMDKWVDYTKSQREVVENAVLLKRKGTLSEFEEWAGHIAEWWNPAKTGDENAQVYLDKAKAWGITPKFPQFAGQSGYWKMLVDRKMYDNEGNSIVQRPVQPEYDMAVISKMLKEYQPDPAEAHQPTVDKLSEKLPKELPENELMTGAQWVLAKGHAPIMGMKRDDRTKQQQRTADNVARKIINGILGGRKVEEGATKKSLSKTQKAGYQYLFELDKLDNAFPGQAKAIFSIVERYSGMTDKRLENELKRITGRDPKAIQYSVDSQGGDGGTVRFSKTVANDVEKNLYVAHNISTSGLRHMLSLGGMPAPSLAVASVSGSPFTSYGEITLLAGPSILDSNKASVFDADIYSPRFPSATNVINDKKFNDMVKWAQSDKHKMSPPDYSGLEGARDYSQLMYSDSIKYAWLRDNGKAPRILNDREFNIRKAIANKFRDKKTEADFEQWAMAKFDDLVEKKVIFKGFTYSGKRRYIPYNLDNILKEMTASLRGGEGFNYGAGNIRAAFAKKFRNIGDIQKNRNRVVSGNDMEALKSESQDKLSELLEFLKPYYKYKSDSFGYYDDASSAIAEGYKGLREAFDLDGEARTQINEYIEYLKNLPTEYFEAKIQRVVSLAEFDTAVVPKGTPEDIVKALTRKGIDVKFYKKGDSDNRIAEVRQAATLFSKSTSTQSTPQTPTQVQAELSDKFGKRGTAQLLQKTVRIIEGQEEALADVKKGATPYFSKDGTTIQAYTKDGRITLVSSGIQTGQSFQVLLHEIEHLTNLGFKNNAQYKQILSEIAARTGENSKFGKLLSEAKARIPSGTNPEHVNSEILAYLIENNRTDISIVRRFIAMIKAALVKMGINPSILNADDFKALAISAARGRVNAEMVEGVKQSVPSIFKPVDPNSLALARWLGNSQITTPVYHGSPESFWTFDNSKLAGRNNQSPGAGIGHFFATDRTESQAYAGVGGDNRSFYVKLENPKRMTADQLPKMRNAEEARAYSKRLQLAGFDGVILTDEGHVIVFENTQVKSAEINTGAFDAGNPDVRYSVAANKADENIAADLGTVTERVGKKLDLKPWESVVATAEYTLVKVPAGKRMIEAAERRAMNKVQFENWQLDGTLPADQWAEAKEQGLVSEENYADHYANTHNNYLNTLKGLAKEEYDKFKDYLVQVVDRTGNAFRVKRIKGYEVKTPLGEVLGLAATVDDARELIQSHHRTVKGHADGMYMKDYTYDKTEKWTVVDPKGKQISSHADEKVATEAMLKSEGVHMTGKGYSDAVVNSVRTFREMTNRSFDLQVADLRRIVAEREELGLPPLTVDVVDERKRWAIRDRKGKNVTTYETEQEAIDQIHELAKYKPGFSRANIVRQTDLDITGPATLQDYIALIGDLRGSYFPRQRDSGGVIMTAINKKTGDRILEKYDLFITKGVKVDQETGETIEPGKLKSLLRKSFNYATPLARRSRELATKGYDISIDKDNAMPESVFATAQLASAITAMVDEGLANVEGKPSPAFQAAYAEIHKQIIGTMADIFKQRGALSSRMKRAENYYSGFETDPLKAGIQYAKGMAGGIAKRKAAQEITLALTGRDITWEDYKKANPEGDWAGYTAMVNERKADPKEQPNFYREALSWTEEILRNSDQADRLLSTLRGLAVVKYLAFRVSSAAVNMTNLVQAVPATISSHSGGTLRGALAEVANSLTALARYKRGEGSAEEKRIFSGISERGWDSPLFNTEAAGELKGKWGGRYSKFTEWGMWMFGKVEEINRAATIHAAYKQFQKSKPGLTHEELMGKAHHVSDRAHQVYGKETAPVWTRGNFNPLKMSWTFMKFSQGYMLNMAEMVGKGDLKNATYMLLSPAILGGIGASIATPILMAALSAIGVGGDDPEEALYSWAEKEFGSDRLLRHGLPGLAGINIKGSLQVNNPFPTKIEEIFGAPGSLFFDMRDAYKELKKGAYSKAAEKAFPTAMVAPFKAYREYNEGVTTGSYSRVFYGNQPLKGTGYDAVLRSLSINPSSLSGTREKQYSEQKIITKYQEIQNDIYTQIKHDWIAGGNRISHEGWIEIGGIVDKYNARIKATGIKDLAPIQKQNIGTILRRASVAPKAERRRAATQ